MSEDLSYSDCLAAWCHASETFVSDGAARLGESFHAQGLSPVQIVEQHTYMVEKLVKPGDARGIVAAQYFLLQVMIAYGTALRAHSEASIIREKQAMEVAEEKTRQNAELLANIVHELGTPLTVIQGNVAVLRKFVQPSDLLPSEIAQSGADLDAAIARMGLLRGQLMAGEREQEKLELVPLMLDRQFERAVRWAEPALQKKGLELRLELTCPDLTVSADEQALASVFGNLLSNAIRYTPAGGVITCSTRRAGAALIAEVTDTGIGMSEDETGRIFDRFYRTERAKEVSSFGLGLGLFLTKGLVEAIGGTISLDSAIGRGSTFVVTLPHLENDHTE